MEGYSKHLLTVGLVARDNGFTCFSCRKCFIIFTIFYAVPKYHRCSVENITSVTHDSKVFSLRLPAGSYLNVPTGHHLAVRAVIDGKFA